MTNRYYIGPAGWSYPDWEGVIYPRQVCREKRQLAWIAQWFNLVEINSTFYRIPPARTAARWVETVSDRPGFRFAVKLFQGFTHERELAVPQIQAFRELLAVFREGGVLGGVLAQFPWSCRCERREKIHLRKLLDAFSDFPLVVEVRHRSWDVATFYAYLRERNVSFCNIDQPSGSQSLSLSAHVTAGRAYLRLHGRNHEAWFRPGASRDERYNYLYSEAEIEELARMAATMADAAEEVYIVTNNHYRGKAVLNASQLAGRLVPGYATALTLSAEDVK